MYEAKKVRVRYVGIINTYKTVFSNIYLIAGVVVGVSALILLALILLPAPPYSEDSWSYYELSRTIWHDFYHVTTWRQYSSTIPYSGSFPPIWPLFISFVDEISGIGIYAGYAANFVICAITLLILLAISSRLYGTPSYGFFLFLGLLLTRGYLDEVAAARSIPLSILLTLLVFYVFIGEGRLGHKRIAVISLLAATTVLCRFDFLLPAVALGFVAAMYSDFDKIKTYILYNLWLILGLSPWMFYSFSHFGVLFYSDNSLTAISTVNIHVAEFHADKVSTLFDEPELWLEKVIANMPGTLIALKKSIQSNYVALIFLVLSAITCIRSRCSVEPPRKSLLAKIVMFAAIFIPLAATVIVSGYKDVRYFIVATLFLSFVFAFIFNARSNRYGQKRWFMPLQYTIIIICYIALIVYQYDKHKVNGFSSAVETEEVTFNLKYSRVTECLEKHDRKRVLFLGSTRDAYKYGALTGIETFPMPKNLNPGNVSDLVRKYSITHLLLAGESSLLSSINIVQDSNDCDSRLYLIAR